MKLFNQKRNINKPDREGDREIMLVTYVFLALFIGMIAYLLYYTQFLSGDIINNSYNKRQDLLAKKVVRGDILSRDNEVLATTITSDDGEEVRNYPYGSLFAHAVGFSTHGRSGVESIANFNLLTSSIFIGDRISNDLKGIKNPGNKVTTTLDVYIQQVADLSLGNKRGAVILSDVSTGEILALVSKPDFDPNSIIYDYETIDSDNDASALLNRATQGLYPPGSTFKIVTALEYIKEHPDYLDYEFDCNSSFSYDGSTINCFHGTSHGHVDFETSFTKSCNSSFANISTMLNKRKFAATCEELLFNEELPIPFSYKQSSVPINSSSDTDEVMQTAIGQGKTGVTPMHMNMITSAIANDGILMRPMVISKIESANDDLIEEYEPEEYARLLSGTEAEILKDLMRNVVLSGTATKARDTYGYYAAGKTGSAEYTTDKSRSHAWFTGYAGVDAPEVAVTVIVEDGGSGGEVAVPIAKSVLDAYFGQK